MPEPPARGETPVSLEPEAPRPGEPLSERDEAAEELAEVRRFFAKPPRVKRRRLRAVRRLVGVLVPLFPVAWMVWTDFLRRGKDIVRFSPDHKHYYELGVALSAVIWTPLLYYTSRRRGIVSGIGAVVFVTLFTIIMGIESAFHATWNVYLCIDGQLHSKSIWQSIWGTLPLGRPLVMFHMVAAFLAAIVFVRYARRFTKTGPWAARIAFVLSLATFVGGAWVTNDKGTSYRGDQASPPDSLYFHGMLGLVKETIAVDWPEWAAKHDIKRESPDRRVQRRDPEKVPPLHPKPAKKRNVVLILEESTRGDVTCNDHDPRCDKSTPWTNAVVPDRMPLDQLRSNASTTAISISNIWSGVRPTESRELLHSVPLLWEYAAAAGYDTAYWTSQNLMFGNARVYVEDLPISHGCVATHLDPSADLDTGAYDNYLTEWVKKDWPEMKEPFFAVIHYSNPHYPYVFDPELAPFEPAEKNHDASKNSEFFNYYKDVVYLSDVSVAEMIRYIRSTDAGKRTVIVFTADHGESFREHWQMGHTSSIYDEEVHVPGWIDAPPGTLSDDERQAIVDSKDDYLWHLDLAPTFLDLLGVWDDPALAPFRARMMGHPITRRERTLAPIPMTNCTWVWECAFRNWGMMQGPRKIEAREWDGAFHCFDLRNDPDELTDLGERMCAPLPDLARQLFHAMPNVTPPGRTPVDWGQ